MIPTKLNNFHNLLLKFICNHWSVSDNTCDTTQFYVSSINIRWIKFKIGCGQKWNHHINTHWLFSISLYNISITPVAFIMKWHQYHLEKRWKWSKALQMLKQNVIVLFSQKHLESVQSHVVRPADESTIGRNTHPGFYC